MEYRSIACCAYSSLNPYLDCPVIQFAQLNGHGNILSWLMINSLSEFHVDAMLQLSLFQTMLNSQGSMTVLKIALITAEVHGKTSINLNCCWSEPLVTMEAHIKKREGTAILVYFQPF